MEKIRELRQEHHMTTVALAAKMGTTRGTITRWEKGQRSPDVEAIKTLARVFGVTIDELVAEVGENPPSAPEESPGKGKTPQTVKRDRRRTTRTA